MCRCLNCACARFYGSLGVCRLSLQPTQVRVSILHEKVDREVVPEKSVLLLLLFLCLVFVLFLFFFCFWK